MFFRVFILSSSSSSLWRHEEYLPMIPLGLKETKEVDFFEQFSDFILEHYSVDPSNFEDSILDLIDTRQVGVTMNECVNYNFSIFNESHLRHREHRREILLVWSYYVNTTISCITPKEDSSPLIEILACILSGSIV